MLLSRVRKTRNHPARRARSARHHWTAGGQSCCSVLSCSGHVGVRLQHPPRESKHAIAFCPALRSALTASRALLRFSPCTGEHVAATGQEICFVIVVTYIQRRTILLLWCAQSRSLHMSFFSTSSRTNPSRLLLLTCNRAGGWHTRRTARLHRV